MHEVLVVFMIVLAAVLGGILLEWDNGGILAYRGTVKCQEGGRNGGGGRGGRRGLYLQAKLLAD